MEKQQDNKRLIAYLILMGLLVITVISRLTYLMLYLPSRQPAPVNRTAEIERGPILERNGKILAIQTRLNSVSASIPEIDNIKETARQLAGILGMEAEEIARRLQRQAQFAWLKRKITQEESQQIMQLIRDGQLKGIHLEPESARTYPQQKIASHILGIAGIDNTGLEGIEAFYNDELSPQTPGQPGEISYGNQIFLTIDLNVQFSIEEIAAASLKETDADSVTILVMNAKNAKLLGSCSLPDFNPNNFNEYPESNRVNRPVVVAYEPGSVFKIFSLASFLELGVLHETDTFVCNGFYEIGTDPINCLGVHGVVTPQRIIMLSCNVGAAYASEKASSADFYQMLLNFGFGKPTGIPLPWESAGILNHPMNWSGRSKPTIAFGQEISVSALQMITAATVLTNQGTLLQPLLVEKILSPTGTVIKQSQRTPVRQVVSPKVAQQILLMMETATSSTGTARRAAIDGIRIAAKTGTAQVPDPVRGGYYANHHMASFLGIFPVEDPQLIVYVLIDHPRGESYYGSQLAAPVFKQVAEQLIRLLDVKDTTGLVITHPGELVLPPPGTIKLGDTMPDLLSTPKRLLLSLYEREDLLIRISGDGYVVRQSPQAGTPLQEGMQIILELE